MYPSINSLLLQISLSYFPHNQTFNPCGCRWELNCFWFPSSLSQRHLLKPTDSLICVLHPSTPLYWTGVDDSELYHKLGHATYIQNEITPMWRRAKKENRACCSQKWTVISEKSAPAVSAFTDAGKWWSVTVQRKLTCRSSTRLSHSSCSSLRSTSESSWSRNTSMLQFLFHGFSTLVAGV